METHLPSHSLHAHRLDSDEDALGLNTGDWFYLAMQEATNSHDYERNAKWAAADEQWKALEQ